MKGLGKVEGPTLLVLAATYGLWALATLWVAEWSVPLAMLLVALTAAQHSSLQHEVLHGHPTPWKWLNEALVFPALTVAIPYIRFRDSHLEHHRDANLTDPYDDPESNYLDPAVWEALPGWARAVLRVNNTLAGRILIGPMVGQITFVRSDYRAWRAGAQGIARAWIWHIPALALVLIWMLALSPMPLWAWLLATYASLSILKIRTYLEHQAHERARGRTVVIADRGLLAFLFLNNNFHVVHHMHPKLPWYELPGLFAQNRDRYLGRNDGYYYRSYADIFRRYLFSAKDPVPHPLWPKR